MKKLIILLLLLSPLKVNASQQFILYDFDSKKEIKTFTNYRDANQYRRKLGRDKNYGITTNGKLLVVNYGVVEIPNQNIVGNGYTNGAYGKDGLFLGRFNNKIEMLLSNQTFSISENEVKIRPYQPTLNLTHYKKEGRELIHYISTNLDSNYLHGVNLGIAPEELKENTKYYSYDGKYFYDDYKVMVNDFVNETKNAVNKVPYYNYYLYLPYRTKTSYTEYHFKQYFDKLGYHKPYTSWYGENLISRFNGTEKAFIDSQNTYGANALLTYGIGKNESADGYSHIAQDKFNLFGHGAYDSSPYTSASGYNSNSGSIYDHANIWMSNGYLKATDWRYYGTHLGNKLSGVNVKYASDPYWSEKAISNYYLFDKHYGLKDLNKYTIGINHKKDIIVYQNPNGKILYNLGTVEDRPFVILEEKENHYKIQSELPLNKERTYYLKNEGRYNFEHSYGYIKKEDIFLLIGKPLQEEKIVKKEKAIPFKEEIRYSNYTDKDVILQNGEEGILLEEITYVGDKEINRKTKVIKESKSKIIVKGTKPKVTLEDIERELKTIFTEVEDNYLIGLKTTLPKTILGEKVKAESYATGNILEVKDKKYIMIKKGDINKDGRISVRDIAQILNHIEQRKQLDTISMKAITREKVSVRVIADILNHIEQRRIL